MPGVPRPVAENAPMKPHRLYYKAPKNEAAERERVWREARALRMARAEEERNHHPDYPERAPARAAVEEPEEPDDRDLVEWWAEEFPIDARAVEKSWRPSDPKRRTLHWLLSGRKSVDTNESPLVG